MLIRQRLKRTFFAAFLWLLALVGYCGTLQLVGNVHPIIEGEAYRSAQLSGDHLAALVQRYGIKTVINLRGENANQQWYQQELEASQSLGVTHIDFAMSSKLFFDETRAKEIINILANAQKPVLIHCRGGSDRTGLVSALYLAAVAGKDEETAEQQLSLRYGHIGLPGFSARAMDISFEALEPMLGFPES